MIVKRYKKIEKDVAGAQNYSDDIQLVEKFFNLKGLNIEDASILFWNHLIALLKRIDESKQYTSDQPLPASVTKEAETLTSEFVYFMSKHRQFNVTPFEKYLLTILFKKIA